MLLWFETTSTSLCFLKPTWAKVDFSYWRQTSLVLETNNSVQHGPSASLETFLENNWLFCFTWRCNEKTKKCLDKYYRNCHARSWRSHLRQTPLYLSATSLGVCENTASQVLIFHRPELGRWKVQQNIVVAFSAGSEKATFVVQWCLSPHSKRVAGSVPMQACLCGGPALCVVSLYVSFNWSPLNSSQDFGESVFSLFLITLLLWFHEAAPRTR